MSDVKIIDNSKRISNALRLSSISAAALLLQGCFTPMERLIEQDTIRVGMTKGEVSRLSYSQASFEDDLSLPGCFYEFIAESGCEILSGSAKKHFLVFCGAYTSSSCTDRTGNSRLTGIYRSLADARASTTSFKQASYRSTSSSGTNSTSGGTSRNLSTAVKIQLCKDKGLKPGTPAFKKCFAEQ